LNDVEHRPIRTSRSTSAADKPGSVSVSLPFVPLATKGAGG
jgi:hypothetical protein